MSTTPRGSKPPSGSKRVTGFTSNKKPQPGASASTASSKSQSKTGSHDTQATTEYTHWARPWTINAERRGSNHWSSTRALTAEWREAFWALGLQTRSRYSAVHVEVEVAMRHPIADTGACYGSVKAAIDGLVDARVLPDDGPDCVLSILMFAPQRVAKGEPERLTLRLRPGGHDERTSDVDSAVGVRADRRRVD